MRYSLKRQLIVHYGVTAIVTITVVVLLGTLSALYARTIVQEETLDFLEHQLSTSIRTSAISTADLYHKRLTTLRGTVSILAQLVQDRFDDRQRVFVDQLTRQNKYPLKTNLDFVPFDWQIRQEQLLFRIQMNATDTSIEGGDGIEEAFGSSYRDYYSTKTPFWFVPGSCDPSVTDPRMPGYHDSCPTTSSASTTPSNQRGESTVNNTSANATDTIQDSQPFYNLPMDLHQMGTDVSVYLKPLWEASEPWVVFLGVYFFNSAKGATLLYPSFLSSKNKYYQSNGCDWLLTSTNPNTNMPYGTVEQIQDHCHAPGTFVDTQEYNPMERAFCQDQIAHPGETRVFGPYRDSTLPDGAPNHNDNPWRLTVGQAVFDRFTGEFLACTGLEVNLSYLQADVILSELGGKSSSMSTNILNATDVAILKPNGTIVAGGGDGDQGLWLQEVNDMYNNTGGTSMHIADTDFIEEDVWQALMDNFQESQAKDGELKISETSVVYRCTITSRLFTLAATQFGDFYILMSADIDESYGQVIESINDDIQGEVSAFIWTTVAIGLFGLILFLLVVWAVSEILTRPLLYMESVAWKIVNHNSSAANAQALLLPNMLNNGSVTPSELAEEENVKAATTTMPPDSDFIPDEVMFNMDEQMATNNPFIKCTPKTEISELVDQFQIMIQGFSGTGSSRAARANLGEIRNLVTWKDPIQTLYDLNPKVRERLQQEQAKSNAQAFGRRLSWQLPMSTGYSMDDSNNEEDMSGMFRSATLPNTSHDSATQSASAVSANTNPNGGSNQFGFLDNSTRLLLYGSKPRTNLGSNLLPDIRRSSGDEDDGEDSSMRIHRSALFRWILCCIALPLLSTIVVISLIVALELLNAVPNLFDKGSDASFDLAVDGMRRTAGLRAAQAEQVLPSAVRDLHLLTRVAGWLLFEALNHSDTFTEADMTLVEECKSMSVDTLCPYQTDITRSPCDCEWNDPWGRQCRNFPAGSRHLQRTFFLSQARDFDPVTGYRNYSSSYPEYDSSPDTTLWWTDIMQLPGASRGYNSSGYATTFDRARVSSASSVVIFPTYNYVATDQFQISHTSSMSSYLAFEPDGSYSGYAGCNDDFAQYAHFKSSGFNRAYLADPDLCPIGRYGYDPRCRFWYTVARDKALKSGQGLHVTAPYTFATVEDIGTTAVSPLIDPKTGEFVGVTAIDFAVGDILPLDMEQSESSFFFVISPDTSFEADTVVGPDFPIGSQPQPIGEIAIPYDDPDSENAREFEYIISEMKSGASGEASFLRTNSDGVVKSHRINFAPIHARSLTPTQPDDYGQGVDVSKLLIYSIGIVRTDENLRAPFQANKDDISEQLELTAVVYLISVTIVTLICILITARISVSVSRPMMILLQIVKRVNCRRIEDDLPPLAGGSREANQIYTSFAKLYKIVRMSNASFFSGDFKWAHHIATDALKLFRKIEDEKAIAIASNNVCNTLLALGLQRREKGTCMLVDGCCCVKMAIEHINEAIDSGNRDFDRADTDAEKAQFAQQLGDRHFNRAMCLLHSLDDPCCAQNGRDVAYADLVRCRDYDNGVREFFMHERLMFKYSDVCYDRAIRRLHGLASLFPVDKAVWHIWDVNDLIDQADTMLQAAWDQEEAPLFRTMTPVGRLQQLEGAVINLELVSGKIEEAARLAMRMLVEDEFLLDMSFAFAASSVLRYIGEQKEKPWPNDAITRTRKEFRKMRKSAKRTALDIGTCYIFCVEITEKLQETTFRSVLSRELLAFYDDQCGYMDSVGLVALSNSVESNLILRVSTREQDEGNQQDTIKKAARELASNTSYPALPTAVNMVVAAARAKAHDVTLVYISDGSIWDPGAFQKMHTKIDKASRRQGASIDVLAIGLGVPQDSEFAEHCGKLCLAARSRHSGFFSANSADELEEVFENLGALNSSVKSSPESHRIQLGITMERF